MPTPEMFDGPVPGQSLTDTPQNAPWEHPPQYVNPQDALDTLFQGIMVDKNLQEIIAMLDAGIPVESLVKVLLFSGFSQGKWTFDLMQLLVQPTFEMLVAIGTRAKVKDMQVFSETTKKESMPNLAPFGMLKMKKQLNTQDEDDTSQMTEAIMGQSSSILQRPQTNKVA